MEQIAQRLNPSRSFGKYDRATVKCFRCQKMGHFASECTAPAPIYRKTSAVFVEGEEEEEVVKLEGVVREAIGITPDEDGDICQSISCFEEFVEKRSDSTPSRNPGEVDQLTSSGSRDSALSVTRRAGETVQSDCRGEEAWVDVLTRVCVSHLPLDHPCSEYLKGRGLDLGVPDILERFTVNPSLLGGKRWYLSVTVKGRTGEFLVDTGASHSIISKKFYGLVSDGHENLDSRVSARSADGSSMQTFGRIFMKLVIEGKEYVVRADYSQCK